MRERLKDVATKLCADCQRRADTNPLRVLDCKVPEDQPIIDTLPSMLDHLCDECASHFAAVKRVPCRSRHRYTVRPRLVRGLDYYTRTTFEIVHGALGAQNSVLGGGRYDGLAEALGSKVPAPGIGFSIGEDRLVMAIEGSTPSPDTIDIFIAPMGSAHSHIAACLHATCGKAGAVVEVSTDAKLKRALETRKQARGETGADRRRQ